TGSNDFLDPVSGGPGPALKYALSLHDALPISWVPVGVEATATGYEVAFKLTGTNTYTVWNTDSSGNYNSSAIGGVSGNSAAFERSEEHLHEDHNAGRLICVLITATMVEAFGST